MLNRRNVLPLLLIYIMCGTLHAQGTLGKLSPYVRQAVIQPSENPGARQTAQGVSQSTPGTDPTGDGPRLTAFVQLLGAGGETALRAHGCRVYDQRGDIAIASIPRRSLLQLAASPAIRRIEAGTPCRLSMDTTAQIAGALPAYEGRGLPQAYTGEGVVVGVMDVGFDLTHPTFLSSDFTQCRIGALWDQLSADTVGSPWPVGRDYVGGDALLSIGHSADGLIETHGTHTAGIAAGGGYGSPYRGVAFASELCLVANAVTENAILIDSADRYKYTTATDALGFKYIFDYAERQGKPCVASFSEGYSPTYDAEDSLFSEYLARLVGPGRLIVSAAGNESRNTAGTYIGKPAGTPEAGAFLLGDKRVYALVRGRGDYAVRLIGYNLPARDSLSIPVSSLPADTARTFAFVSQEGDTLCAVTAQRYVPSLADRTPMCLLTIVSPSSIGSLRLALVLSGEDEVEALSRSGAALFCSQPATDARWNAATSTHNVLAPSCFPSVIAVGATTHRAAFTNWLGQLKDQEVNWRDLGRRGYYSSVGPAVDGLTKPDVAAPGTNIVSSYSSFYEAHNPEASDLASDVARFTYGDRTYAWNSNTGTSMACPVVAGVLALWLEACPTLTPQEAMALMASTSHHPDSTLAYPNNLYGHGEIDAYRGLLSLLGLSPVEGLSQRLPSRVAVEVADGGLRLRFTGEPPTELDVALYSVGGAKIRQEKVRPAGQGSLDVALPRLASGVYAVQVRAKEAAFTGSTLVRLR